MLWKSKSISSKVQTLHSSQSTSSSGGIKNSKIECKQYGITNLLILKNNYYFLWNNMKQKSGNTKQDSLEKWIRVVPKNLKWKSRSDEKPMLRRCD